MVGQTKKGNMPMFTTFAPARETATALVAAFFTAMLLVGSATSIIA
jgi:hypothetical protein